MLIFFSHSNNVAYYIQGVHTFNTYYYIFIYGWKFHFFLSELKNFSVARIISFCHRPIRLMCEKMSRCDCLKNRGEGKRSPPNSCRNYFYIQKRKNLVPFPLALWNCLRRIWNFQKYSHFFFSLYFLRSRIFVLGRNYPLMYLYIFIAVMPKYLVTPQLSSTLNKATFSPVNPLYYAVDVYWKRPIVSEFVSYFVRGLAA